MARFFLTVLGCKVNQYDAAALAEALMRLGLTHVEGSQAADLAVIHTCCVTATAMHKSRQAIRRARRRWPHAAVLVTGCYGDYDAQTIHRVLTDSGLPPERALVAGNQNDLQAVLERISQSMVEQCGGTSMPMLGGFAAPIRNDQCMSAGKFGRDSASSKSIDIKARRKDAVKRNMPQNSFLPPISSFPGHQRAFVKVQDGCDAFCAYCVVPYTRCVLWSRPIPEVRAECATLLAAGHREIVLSGIFLGAYGRKTAIRRRWSDPKSEGRTAKSEERNGEERFRVAPPSPLGGVCEEGGANGEEQPAKNRALLLPELVRTIRELPGLWRLRLSSLEPLDLTEELLDACNHPAVAPHFHLPLQSGSAAILARMNRQYTPGQYRRGIDRLRQAIPRVAITTDIIVGFPRETEEDFAATLELARHAGFSKIHAFPFSPIEGTAAWLWRKLCPQPQVVHDRMTRLAELERALAENYRKQFIGETMEALVEKSPARSTTLVAMTDRYITVFVPRPPHSGDLTGQVVRVRIESLHEEGLSGKIEP